MAKKALIIGEILFVLGIVAYFLAEKKSPTAFIPSGFGAIISICGVIAFKEAYRKHAMHVAVVVGLLGALASTGRLISKLATGEIPPPVALGSLVLMAILCTVFVVLCVQSFIAARKAQRAAEAETIVSGTDSPVQN